VKTDNESQGPIYFQQKVRETLMEHRAKEEQNGGAEIWPAVPQVKAAEDGRTVDDEKFCSKLSACAGERPEYVW
jgi:hypothetical protein